MKIGYARVSTDDQSADLQLDALNTAGCDQIYVEKVSGALGKAKRPELNSCLKSLRKGDTLVCWRLDRLGRSLQDLVNIIEELREKEIYFESLSEKIETESSTGRLVFHLFAALSEFERNLIRERTKAGLEAARARGRKGGRRPIMTRRKLELAKSMLASGHTYKEVANSFGITRGGLYQALARAEREAEGK